jgi:hypothetical protein
MTYHLMKQAFDTKELNMLTTYDVSWVIITRSGYKTKETSKPNDLIGQI